MLEREGGRENEREREGGGERGRERKQSVVSTFTGVFPCVIFIT